MVERARAVSVKIAAARDVAERILGVCRVDSGFIFLFLANVGLDL